jgi:hypothetical protein
MSPETHNSYVYGIRFTKEGHEHSGRIRYVGKSVCPERRFENHMKPHSACRRIARSVAKHGAAAFSLEILETVSAETLEEADRLALAAEIRHIEFQNTALGPHGLNMTLGGEGARLTAAGKKKLSEVQKRRFADPTVLKEHREMVRRRNLDPVYLAKARAASAEVQARPEHKAKISANLKQLHQNPEFVARKIEGVRKSNKRPEVRAKQNEGQRRFNTPQVRLKKAELARNQHQDPVFAEKYSAGLRKKHSDPAYARRHAGQTKDRHKDPAFGRSARMGIHLHWAKQHDASGNAAAADRQRQSMIFLLAQAGRSPVEQRIVALAKEYLSQSPVAAGVA